MQEEYTVGTWAECWFTRNAENWSANTESGYRNLIFRHIIPGIGRIRLKKLKPPHLRVFYDKLAVSGPCTMLHIQVLPPGFRARTTIRICI